MSAAARVTFHQRAWTASVPGAARAPEAAGAPGAAATLLVVHGLSEHSERYAGFAATATEAGFSVAAVDLYGHGESPGRRGHIRGFDVDHLAAVDQLVRRVEHDTPDSPLFVVGHSLGGLVALRWAQSRVFARRLRGLVLIAPFIENRLPVPAWKLLLARLLDRLAPGLTLPTGIADEDVFRDPAARADFAADPLVQRRISARHWAELTRERQRLWEGAGALTLPTLMLLAGEDRIIGNDAARELADRLPACAVIEYPDAFHALHHDPVGPAMTRDLLAWVRARLAA